MSIPDTTAAEAAGQPEQVRPAGFAGVLRYFLRLGTLGFGGPIAVVGYMQRDLVESRGWIEKRDFWTVSRSARRCPGRWRRRWRCGSGTSNAARSGRRRSPWRSSATLSPARPAR